MTMDEYREALKRNTLGPPSDYPDKDWDGFPILWRNDYLRLSFLEAMEEAMDAKRRSKRKRFPENHTHRDKYSHKTKRGRKAPKENNNA